MSRCHLRGKIVRHAVCDETSLRVSALEADHLFADAGRLQLLDAIVPPGTGMKDVCDVNCPAPQREVKRGRQPQRQKCSYIVPDEIHGLFESHERVGKRLCIGVLRPAELR